MSPTRALALVLFSVFEAGFDSVGVIASEGVPNGIVSKAEIERCLLTTHQVGGRVFFPVPQPGYVFKPGYNFMVRESDGSLGFGHQQAANGRIVIRYPAHHTMIRLDVMWRDGVVYFGSEATSCR